MKKDKYRWKDKCMNEKSEVAHREIVLTTHT